MRYAGGGFRSADPQPPSTAFQTAKQSISGCYAGRRLEVGAQVAGSQVGAQHRSQVAGRIAGRWLEVGAQHRSQQQAL